ncbi:MAG: hypothetical protein WC913_10900, partial [Desulfuromonas sp.]
MKGLIKNGISKTQLSIHAWLTLPTCEIMDFTIQTTSAVINKAKKGLGGVFMQVMPIIFQTTYAITLCYWVRITSEE